MFESSAHVEVGWLSPVMKYEQLWTPTEKNNERRAHEDEGRNLPLFIVLKARTNKWYISRSHIISG